MTTHLKESTNATGVGNDTVSCFGKHEFRILRRNADIAQKCSLERSTDGPTLDWDDHGCIEFKELLDALVAAGHELVVGQSRCVITDRADVTAR